TLPRVRPALRPRRLPGPVDALTHSAIEGAAMNDVAVGRTAEPEIESLPEGGDRTARRVDIDNKQALIASFLKDIGRDGVLLLEPANFAWLTAGAVAQGALDPALQPALFFSAEQRWLLSANADSQRLFDEELDGLGFQLKEWPWYWSRDKYLVQWAQGRSIA